MSQTVETATYLAGAAERFGAPRIALTAGLTGVLTLAAAAWRLPRSAWSDVVALGALSAAAVFLWRMSANMPQLNSDGLPGFSANDWLAPVMTYFFLSAYTDLRSPSDPRRYGQIRTIAVVISLFVNVVTI
ncbi:hypothetical protein A5756_20390 [Mycobacterium sp. 852002-53434_SCH5985345]|uniref:hypothetical protein n=1 Tax=unclassified Mycobacterium TaxID=2642494 RepID=UPI0007FC484E|nr:MULTISPECIES: hypothetical protein [unclassified Mycobacterium]OBF51343.1 hypothetical protein A5756_20390 [Mycobacterium sp. 852002-53434_SCH5985345]OBF95172.1 hypothetical protein A5773_15155 [Mycobacterium sp. 852014-52450_SCH5900713]